MKYCEQCPFQAHKSTFYKQTPSDILIVGDQAPIGKERDIVIKLVKEVLNYELKDVAYINSINCNANVKEDVKTTNKALGYCSQYVDEVIEIVKPKLIITMGSLAIKTILRKTKLLENRGRIFTSSYHNDLPVLVTVSPKYCLLGADPDYPNGKICNMSIRERIIFNDFELAKTYQKTGSLAIDSTNYTEVTDETVLDRLKNSGYPIAFDLETSSLRIYDRDTRILSVSVSNSEGESLVTLIRNNRIPPSLSNLLSSDLPKAVANRPFDENALKQLSNVDVGGKIYDVLTMAHCIDENAPSYKLEDLTNSFTTLNNIKDLSEGQRHNLEGADPSLIVRYNGVDSDSTLRCFNVLKKKLDDDEQLQNYYDFYLNPVQTAFSEMSFNGCKVNLNKLRDNGLAARAIAQTIEAEALALVPEEIKEAYLSSVPLREQNKDNFHMLTKPKFLMEYLFRHPKGLRLKPVMRTPLTKVPQLTEDHFKYFTEYPFINHIMRFSKIEKVRNTYLDTLWNFVNPDGNIYPSILFTRTVTGRSVILDPPIQTYPQRGEFAHMIKECIVADDGFLMGARDLGQSELRIIGWLAQDKNILRALYKGIDLHTLTAAMVNDIPIEKVTKDMRQKAKAVNFGFVFGMMAKKFKDYAKNEYNVDVTMEEAFQIREKFFAEPDGYFALLEFHRKMIKICKRDKCVRGVLGRVRHLPEINSDNDFDQHKAGNQAINFPVQNFSSELGALGMMLMHHEVKSSPKLKANIKMMPWFIHDSGLFQAKESYMDKAMSLFKECLEVRTKEYIKKHWGITVGYPITSDAKIGLNWNEMKEV